MRDQDQFNLTNHKPGNEISLVWNRDLTRQGLFAQHKPIINYYKIWICFTFDLLFYFFLLTINWNFESCKWVGEKTNVKKAATDIRVWCIWAISLKYKDTYHIFLKQIVQNYILVISVKKEHLIDRFSTSKNSSS